MQNTQNKKRSFVHIDNKAFNLKDISTFQWDETNFEINIQMKSGGEYQLFFNDQNEFLEAFYKLNR